MASRSGQKALLMLLASATVCAVASAEAAPRVQPRATDWHLSELVHNDLYGSAAFIGGEFRVRAPASDPEAVAREFLRIERRHTGLQNPNEELRVKSIQGPDELGITHVKFAHYSQGIRVFGSEPIVVMKGNVVTALHGPFLPTIRERLKVRVGGDSASDIAVDELRDLLNTDRANPFVADREFGLDLDESPELVFFNRGLLSDERTSTDAAWRVSVNGYVFFISADSGRVVDSYDNIRTGLSREIYDAKHSTNTPGTLVCSGSSCSSSDADTIGAWNQFGDTYNYFSGTHGRDSYDDAGGTLIGTVHYSKDYQNAYWNGSQMVFGDGMVAEDVTAHELGHGVCQETANLAYKYQSGALNESYSDVWGVMVDREDWDIGEDLQGIGTIRSMEDPNAYGQPKDMGEYKKYIFYDNGGVHINSGIPNYALYLACDGGENDGVVVEGQGRNIAEQIWYRTEVKKLNSSSKFADWARGINSACGELYNSGSDICEDIGKALEAVGL